MKKAITICLLLIGISAFSQRYERFTTTDNSFKRHFSYSIEGGFVDNLPRQFIAGNKSDFLADPSGAKQIQGNSIIGTIIQNGGVGNLIGSNDKILLTDFIVPVRDGNTIYAYGTGIYYPNGQNSYGYVFFATYESSTMIPVSMVYYDLIYPGNDVPKNTAGTRIKYSKREDAFYLCGVMADQVFVDMNFNDIQGRSKGFIMKIDPSTIQAQVMILDPDVLPEGNAQLCSVNDIEIDAQETSIYFTGVTSELDFNGYIHPMAGKIDMNLTLQWCNVYELAGDRFSGIDAELGDHEQSIFILMNSATNPFSIMELDLTGSMLQQPELYNFRIGDCGAPTAVQYESAARGHIMHYTSEGGLMVTGNCFIQIEHAFKQHLFSYSIPSASDLTRGNTSFDSYSCDQMPTGAQIAVTSWWAPENSIYEDNNLSLVGYCRYNNTINHGYVYINLAGYDKTTTDCYMEGTVNLKELSSQYIKKQSSAMLCDKINFDIYHEVWLPNNVTADCPSSENKSTPIEENKDMGKVWKIKNVDNTGIYAYLYSEELNDYHIYVYDVTGKVVYSGNYIVKGQKDIHLKFNVSNQLYLISLSNGKVTENIKVMGVR